MTTGWAGPRPILVGIGSLLLVAAGVVQALVVTLIVAVYGAPALILGVPILIVAVADIIFGWRIRFGRDRRPALIAAFVTLLSAPFTLGTHVLGLTTIITSMIAIVALIRHRAWFEPADSDAETGEADEPPIDAVQPGDKGEEATGSERS
jgi:hypothetical protein